MEPTKEQTEQAQELQKLFDEFAKRAGEILKFEVDTCALFHKRHDKEGEQCIGTFVVSDVVPEATLLMLNQAAVSIVLADITEDAEGAIH